ncbi:hypothetical protein WA026_009464 [Henosepilachna vigintioctopunctata]|uniref:Uncharacterized protein n=1 Tax=Henosepilachna vigintioctopunctata TaxID=420089 RepID=A0AAW1U3V3_9CUCU
MKVIIISVFIFASVSADQCRPRNYYWRPFNGSIPNDAFLAGTDLNGKKNYVAKIIPLDSYSWTVPELIKEDWAYIDFSWCCGGSSPLIRVDKAIEILCTENQASLQWQEVEKHADELKPRCCLVEGGIGATKGHIYIPYIGRVVQKGHNFIGRTYTDRSYKGLHIMNGTVSRQILKDYEVLTYHCDDNEVSLRNGEPESKSS